jgi:hypothetical protein
MSLLPALKFRLIFIFPFCYKIPQVGCLQMVSDTLICNVGFIFGVALLASSPLFNGLKEPLLTNTQ